MQQLGKETVRLLSSSQTVSSVHAVVKELVENSLDAQATNIEVKLENYGLDVIEVRDNGLGVGKTDAAYMACPHYTSKLTSFEDLCSLQSYGFRGEALACIAAVGVLRVTTCTEKDDVAHVCSFNHMGEMIACKPSAMGCGTSVQVSSLFKKVPVRRQYFRSVKRCREDLRRVEDMLIAVGIAHPNVRFVLKHDKCVLWQKIQTKDYASNLAIVFGHTVTQHLTEISFHSCEPMVKLHGYVPSSSSDALSRANPDRMFVFVNNRHVIIKQLLQILRQAYVEAFPSQSGRYPVATLHVNVPPASLDVNLEPNKTSVLLNDIEFVSSTLLSLLSQLYTSAEWQEVERESGPNNLPVLEGEREEQQQILQQQQRQEKLRPHLQLEFQSSSTNSDPTAGPNAPTSSRPTSPTLSISESDPTEPLQPPPLPSNVQMSPNSATAERLEGVAREQCFELKSSNDAISGSDGGWCRAGKVAGCAVRDKDRTSAPEMNLPQATLLQWSRGELIRDSQDRAVEPVRLVQPPTRDPSPGDCTPTHIKPATTSSKPIYPKQSPVYDMINSRPVKRKHSSPTDNARLSSSAKRQETDNPTTRCDVCTAAPMNQPLLHFDPVPRSESLPFNLHSIIQRTSLTENEKVCAAWQDRVVGYCSPPGVWLVLWNGHIACFRTAGVLDVQGFPVTMAQVQTLLDHTISNAKDLTSHLYTVHRLDY